MGGSLHILTARVKGNCGTDQPYAGQHMLRSGSGCTRRPHENVVGSNADPRQADRIR